MLNTSPHVLEHNQTPRPRIYKTHNSYSCQHRQTHHCLNSYYPFHNTVVSLMISDNIVQGSPLAAVNDGSRIALFCQHAEGVFRVIMEPIGGSSIQKKGTDVTTITGSPIALIVMTSVDNPQVILPLNLGSPLSVLTDMWIAC